MRKRLVLLCTLVLLGSALALPASVAAGDDGYHYKIIQNYCSSGGVPNIKLKLIKMAGYTAGRFTIDATGQHSQSGMGNWSNESQTSHFSKNIPAGTAKFTWTKSIFWEPPDSRWHRIKLRLRAIRNGNVIAAATVYSVKC